MQNELFFSTGVFAKMCNITKQTLFHYDDIELLKPHHRDDKGYRYYSHHQFETMYAIETLKELEMPLSEIKEFLNITSPDAMIEVFKEQSAKIANKIEKLTQIQNAIEKKIEITEKAKEQDFSSIYVEEVNETYLYLSEPLLYDKDKEQAKSITHFYNNSLIELNDKFSIGGMITKEEVLQGNFTHFKYLFIETNYTPKLPLYKKEKSRQVIGYHIGKYEAIGETYAKLLNYIENEHLEILDFIYEEYILDAISVSDTNKYVTKIRIPIL